MSHSCAGWRGDIGAYIVGALDGPARARVSRHLAACAGCQADYDELVPVRAWLARLALPGRRPEPGPAGQPGWPPHALLPERPLPQTRPDGAPVPCSCRESGPRSPAQPADRLRTIRPRTRRRLLAAGAALAAAAAFLAVLVISGPSARSFRAADSATGVSGRAQLHGTPTGTQIDLTASGLPGGQRCILVAVARGGADIAGTWDATYDGSARIAGTSAFPASQLTALRIESDTGLLLLSIRV
jgi:hypothetical protein